MSAEVWGYAWSSEPDRWMGACASRDEVIAVAMEEQPHSDGPDPVGECWIVCGKERLASAYLPDAARIIEWMGEHAYDDGACDNPAEWPQVSDESLAELDRLLVEWADRCCSHPLWCVDGEPERVWPPPEPVAGEP